MARCLSNSGNSRPSPLLAGQSGYLGNDRRERKGVNRRVSTWTAGLQKMPAKDRRAIHQAIRDQVECWHNRRWQSDRRQWYSLRFS
jgi:hypothetical protein